MITGLTHLHSSFRYLVLLFIILSIVDAISGMSSGKAYKKSSRIFALLGLIFTHIQLLVGLLLYFLGAKGFNALMNAEGVMKDAALRFYALEHITLMIVAVVLITMGYSKAKKLEDAKRKFKTIAIFYGIALLIIFVMIPWPFLKEFGSWI
ncbi:MAG: hypothetical protein WEC59_08420 [Salibacteraceae bacterium]